MWLLCCPPRPDGVFPPGWPGRRISSPTGRAARARCCTNAGGNGQPRRVSHHVGHDDGQQALTLASLELVADMKVEHAVELEGGTESAS